MSARALPLRLAALVTLWVITRPGVAAACAVCFSGRTDEQREAFGATTAFLTFLPLVVMGAIVWWVRRRARAIAAEASPAGLDVAPERIPAYSGTSIR